MATKNQNLWLVGAALTVALWAGAQPGVSFAAQVEETAMKLSEPAFWVAPALPTASAGSSSGQEVERSVHDVPEQGLVYVYTRQAVRSENNMARYVDILQAYNDQTGELKWKYELHKEGGPYTVHVQRMYNESGGIYIYAQHTDGTARLYDISVTGQLVWSQEVASGGKVSLMGNSLFVYKESEPAQDGAIATTFVQYAADTGRFVSESIVNGTVIFAGNDRVVMDGGRKVKVGAQWQNAAHPQIRILNEALVSLNSYTFLSTARMSAAEHPITVLDDGSLLIQAVDTGQGSILIGFDKDGKQKWERPVSEGALVKAVGAGSYAVYAKGKIELYNMYTKMVERTFSYDPSTVVSMEQTKEGKLRLIVGANVYVLDPQTLKTEKLYQLNDQKSPYDTTDKAVFSIVNNQLAKGLIR